MKIKQTNKNKLLILISVILLMIASSLVNNLFFNQKPQPKKQTEEKSIDKPILEDQPKDQPSETPKKQEKPVETHSDKPIKPVENPDHSYSVSMISSIDIENGSVFVRGGINNLSSDSGECLAELTHEDGTTVTKTTTLLPGPQSSSCKTIEIPIKQLKTGAWTMKLKYKNQNTTGEANVKKFTIQQ